MSFYTSLTGLNAATTELSVTSNNIANAGTAGFKRSSADFGDIFAFQDLAQCVKVYDVIAFSGGDAERDSFVREMALKTYFGIATPGRDMRVFLEKSV